MRFPFPRKVRFNRLGVPPRALEWSFFDRFFHSKKERKKVKKGTPEAIEPDLAGERKAHEVKSVITSR